MTAARKPIQDDAPLDFTQLVEIGEAARLLGKSEGQLRRQCGAKLAGMKMAVLTTPPTGGNPRWFIHRSYDYKLAGGALAARHLPPAPEEVDQFSEKQRADARVRVDCVMDLRRARSIRPGLMKHWIESLVTELQAKHPSVKVSRGSLYRWDKDYGGPGDLIKLIDTRGGDRKSQGDPAAWKYFESIFCDNRRPPKLNCWQRTKEYADHAGLRWCTYNSCLNQLDERIPVERQVYHRDPAEWRSRFAPYIEQDPERFSAGECWVGDHRPLDILCRIDNRVFRPYVTSWQDWRTHKIVGYVLTEHPNSTSILAALRAGLLDGTNRRRPSIIWIDNGKDYDCYAFHGQTKQQRRTQGKIEFNEVQHNGIFGNLGIEVHWSIPHGPQGKARQERWFATVGSQFDKTFATYTGNCPQNKPEDLAAIMKRDVHVPTFHHVAERFAKFVHGYNIKADHSIDDLVDAEHGRLSPQAALDRWHDEVPIFADPSALDLLLQKIHKPIRVGRNGITLTILGERLRYGYLSPELRSYKGTKKQVFCTYDPKDLGRIMVYDDQWRFLCIADMNDLGGRHGDELQEDHLRTVSQKKAAYKRGVKAQREHFEVEYLSDNELLAEQAAKDAAPPTPEPEVPGAMKIVRTPLDGAAKKVQKAKAAKAAGAEAHHPRDEDDYSLPSLIDGLAGGDVDTYVIDQYRDDATEGGGSFRGDDDGALPSLMDMHDDTDVDLELGAYEGDAWSDFIPEDGDE